MTARAMHKRLSDLTIRRTRLELLNPTSFAGRQIEREMEELRKALTAQLRDAA